MIQTLWMESENKLTWDEWMELFKKAGRKGGSSKSKKKLKAARENGKKGGRPRKLDVSKNQ